MNTLSVSRAHKYRREKKIKQRPTGCARSRGSFKLKWNDQRKPYCKGDT